MPQLYADKLDSHLQQSLARVYCIAGDDILLRQESADAVIEAADRQGFNSIEKHFHDKDFEWQSWLSDGQAMSLFAENRVIELLLSSSKIGTEGSQALCEYVERLAEQADSDTVLLIRAPAISGKPKWLNAIIKHGVYVPVYPLEGQWLNKWLINRAAKKQLKLAAPVAKLLAERVEGNTSAAEQELEKLAMLLEPGSAVLEQHIDEWVADSARFSVFQVLDYAIAGDVRRAARALQHLRNEGSVVPAIQPVFATRLVTLLNLSEHASRGQLAKGIQSERIFKKMIPSYERAMQKLQADDLHACMKLCALADRTAKSSDSETAWVALEIILCKLAGQSPAHAASLLADAS